WPGWEDAAVPPDRLGRYLREFDALVGEFGLTSMPFGHFGDGCIHVRLDFPLHSAGGVARVTEFLRAAATLVVGHGGSLSGEHGDGRARSELLSLMYSPEMLRLFGAVKHVFDPGALLNPGVLVDPAPVGDSLRLPAPTLRGPALTLAYSGDSGDFSRAVHRCTGVGKCRSTVSRPDSVMCPSYIATANELDSTRGRARVLQELVNGELVEGWRSPVLHEALDLCLACKGCASDCPTGIDLASYKAEALHQRHRRRLRPRSHYSLGWLPRWARLAGRLPRLANRVAGLPLVGRAALAVAGVDRRRSVPRFAPSSFRRMDRRNRSGSERGRPVVVFVDTFSDHFSPTVVADLVRVLETAGYRPMLSSPEVCCGLTWISTGQLTAARRILGRSIDLLVEEVRRGTPIVGVEPSCTAVLRHDAPELLGTPEAREVAAATRTLAELLAETPDWSPPSLAGLTAVAQPHCHHHAVMGWETDARLLAGLGATVTRVGGCCGLAGNFGVERGHYDISVAVAGQQLLPAVEAAPPDDVVLADGFSCRTQLADLTGRRAHHLAEILARRLPGED
uniref:FAD-binding and (Fe-S)-binding domain-containing protein n=1 Tax=Pseudonocardia pini TaxID=2758030 RepID=UPI0015F00584